MKEATKEEGENGEDKDKNGKETKEEANGEDKKEEKEETNGEKEKAKDIPVTMEVQIVNVKKKYFLGDNSYLWC